MSPATDEFDLMLQYSRADTWLLVHYSTTNYYSTCLLKYKKLQSQNSIKTVSALLVFHVQNEQ